MEINTLSPEECTLLTALIDQSQRIVVVGHSRPDGDATGSSLAWAEYLTTYHHKQVTVVMPNALPDFLQWLPGTERIIRFDKHPDKVQALLDTADLVCCMDFNTLNRVDELAPLIEACSAPRIMIDHHLDPDTFCQLQVSRPDLSSTCETTFRIVWQLGGFEQMSSKFAIPIYTGMMTDTGGFTYNSSRPDLYFIICQLLTKRIDKDKIYRNVFNNYSQWAIRLRGYLMSKKLQVVEKAHACYYSMTREDMERFHFVRGDVEGLVNEPLRIKGMKMSISLREDDRVDNRVWVSLRSVDHYSVQEVARLFFNGGGHLNASGGRLDCSIEEAEEVVKKAIDYFAEHNATSHPQ